MSVNKARPHLYIIPEDDADRQIADGFILHPSVVARKVQVVAPAGGWSRVLDTFKDEYLPLLIQNVNTHVVLLVNFDGDPESRQNRFNGEIPEELRNRVFVVGPRGTPEVLRRSLKRPFEAIGTDLADECVRDTLNTWTHDELRHNDDARLRLIRFVKPFLFDCR